MKPKKAKFSAIIILSLTLIAVLLPLLIGSQTYIMHILILVLIFASFSQTWNLLAGYVGQVSLGQNVFFGVGAYTVALLIFYHDIFKINPWPGIVIGGIFSLIVGLPLAICFRLRGAYFSLATLAFSEVVRSIILNSEFTLDGRGVMIPVPPTADLGIFTIDFRSKIPYYYITLAMLLAIFNITYLIVKSRIGFKFLTIREEEDAALSLGVNPFKMKLCALLISSFICGMLGAIYALYISFIDAGAEPGGVLSSATGLDVIMVSLIGGVGTVPGPLVGSIIRVCVGEILRVYYGWTGGLDLLLFGLILALFIIFLRGGIWGVVEERILRKR